MSNRFSRALALLAAAGLFAVATPARADEGFTPLTVVFHGSVHGEVTDCGCKKKPLGGIARRAELLSQIRAEQPAVALLDGGNLFGRNDEEWSRRTEFLVDETARLDYDGFGLGPWDLWHGLDFLQAAIDDGLQFTSANTKVGGEYLLPRHLVFEQGGVKIGVLSVMDQGFAQAGVPYTEGIAGLELQDPVEAMREVLPQLREEADLIVLLSNMPNGGTADILARVGKGHGIDLAVEGYVTQSLRTVRRVAGVPVLSANNRGKYLGQADLLLDAEGNVADIAWKLHELTLDMVEQEDVATRVADFETKLAAGSSR